MRPFDEIPDDDYSDVALLVAGAREWPSDEFARALDARVARRFATAPAMGAQRPRSRRLTRWAAGAGGAGVALAAAALAAVMVLTGGGPSRSLNGLATFAPSAQGAGTRSAPMPAHADAKPGDLKQAAANVGAPSLGTAGPGTASPGTASSGAASLGAVNATAAAPVAPGARQIQSAQISLSTPNRHVDQVAQEVFGVVALEHGSVQSSHITSATSSSGGGYAWFTLSVPTGNLQDTMTQLSRLRYAAVGSRTDSSQNVSDRYANDQRQLRDAQALRSSLLRQLQSATTQTAIDSIKAQLKLAEQQISSWQATLDALRHRISYSDVTVQINSGGLPLAPVARHAGGLTLGRALDDALHVLVVSAGVALIALAVLVPVGLVAALLVWLWVWLRQRRREHALDSAG